jgi:hypothetical protein
VREAAGPAAGQNESDPRPVRRGHSRIRGALSAGNAPTREPQTCENTTEDPESGPDHPC